VRAAVDAFLDAPAIRGNPHTLRAYTNMLDRAAEVLGPARALADVTDDEIGDVLTGLWGTAKPATWNRNRAAVGSWLTWCATRQHWTTRTVGTAGRSGPGTRLWCRPCARGVVRRPRAPTWRPLASATAGAFVARPAVKEGGRAYVRSAFRPSRSTVVPVFLSVKIRSSGMPAAARASSWRSRLCLVVKTRA